MDTRHSLSKTPLKDMDAALLTLAIIDDVERFARDNKVSLEETYLIKSALRLASYLHRTDTRQNAVKKSTGVVHQPSSPYIEHPLRNTLRLIRWGVVDPSVLIGSLLHDVIEDHPDDIVEGILHQDSSDMTPKEIRAIAVEYIATAFTPEIARIVVGVSNPFTSEDQSRIEKNAVYVAHVKLEVQADAKVFLVKVSDFSDNALSLHHHLDTDVASARRATKYLPLVDIFADVFTTEVGDDIRGLVSSAGYDNIISRLNMARGYLAEKM